jgi:transglutaminase-like putative cysteine protease
MNFHRRDVLKAGAALSFAAALPRCASAETSFAPQPGAWRQFQIITKLEVARADDLTQAWIPLPAVNEQAWFQSNGSTWHTNGKGTIKRDAKYGADMLHVEWTAGEKTPFVEVISNIATRDHAIDLTRPGRPAALTPEQRKLYLGGTDLIPVNGIVKQTSDRIVASARARTDVEKARAIYEWVVDNTYRNASTRGCGIGDIAAMLKSGNLGGKCADLNALYVGLARAAGLPARDIYGIRVAPSKFGYRSLGAASENITTAQHCRSEVYLASFGWVPVDPADVRKVALEEPPTNLAITDPKVVAVRRALFGSWETNWLAYNVAHDVTLPGSKGQKIGFLMYPQAETSGLRLDCLDPDNVKYTILSKEVTPA